MSSEVIGGGRSVSLQTKIKPKAVGKPPANSGELGVWGFAQSQALHGCSPFHPFAFRTCLFTSSSVGKCQDCCGSFSCFASQGTLLLRLSLLFDLEKQVKGEIWSQC